MVRLYTRVDEAKGQPTADQGLENHLGGSEAANYRQYQLDLIQPHLGRSVLEIGAGLGEFSDQLHGLSRRVLSDADPACLQALKERFADQPGVEIVSIDLREDVTLDEPVDSVLLMNVLEHIEDDVSALERLAHAVRPGGTIIIWVPGYMGLYGDFDRKVGHFRRYSPATLRQAVEGAGLETAELRPVNLLGGIAWWLAVRIGSAGSPTGPLVRLYDRIVIPVTRRLESLVRPPFGQTVLGVARVPAPPLR